TYAPNDSRTPSQTQRSAQNHMRSNCTAAAASLTHLAPRQLQKFSPKPASVLSPPVQKAYVAHARSMCWTAKLITVMPSSTTTNVPPTPACSPASPELCPNV